MSDVLKIANVAERLGCSPATVRKLIESGQLRAFTVGSRSRKYWRVSEEAYAAFKGSPSPPPVPAPTLERSPALVTRRFLGGNR
jgi:excisionase family DNA binding protein